MRISTVDRLLGEYTYKAFGILEGLKSMSIDTATSR